MKRRDFSVAAAAAMSLLPLARSANAQPAFVAGKQYLELSRPAPVDADAGKVEVVEFFSYNCPHCAAFEPLLEAWVRKLPAFVAFRRVPVPFVGNDVEVKQRLYYTLEALGKVGEFQQKVFDAIHKERQNLVGDSAVQAWVDKQAGLDGKRFAETFRSFSVVSKAKRATEVTGAYRVAGVPSFGIAGRWYVDGELTGSLNTALQVVEFLADKAKKG